MLAAVLLGVESCGVSQEGCEVLRIFLTKFWWWESILANFGYFGLYGLQNFEKSVVTLVRPILGPILVKSPSYDKPPWRNFDFVSNFDKVIELNLQKWRNFEILNPGSNPNFGSKTLNPNFGFRQIKDLSSILWFRQIWIDLDLRVPRTPKLSNLDEISSKHSYITNFVGSRFFWSKKCPRRSIWTGWTRPGSNY